MDIATAMELWTAFSVQDSNVEWAGKSRTQFSGCRLGLVPLPVIGEVCGDW
jgi:hypothetical protein